MESRINKIKSLRWIEITIILFFWILLIIAPIFSHQHEDEINWNHVYNIWFDYLPLLLLFVINRFALMPFLFFKNKRSLYFVGIIALIALMGLSIPTYNSMVRKGKAGQNEEIRVRDMPPNPPPHVRNQNLENGEIPPQPRPFPPPLKRENEPFKQFPPAFNFLILAILFIGFDIAIQVTIKWVKSEQKRIYLEKDNIENQLAYLKNQVSPHFFMNTLNNIHALIDFDQESAKDSVIKLSNLMRYLLYDSEAKLSPLEKEIEFIQSYVELMKLRFVERVSIQLDLPAIAPKISIPPLLFISLLENAFKHGISYSKDSFINIKLTCNADHVIFKVENSYNKESEKQKLSGIGIENTRRRLDLIYGGSYELVFEDLTNVFKVNLTIPI